MILVIGTPDQVNVKLVRAKQMEKIFHVPEVQKVGKPQSVLSVKLRGIGLANFMERPESLLYPEAPYRLTAENFPVLARMSLETMVWLFRLRPVAFWTISRLSWLIWCGLPSPKTVPTS